MQGRRRGWAKTIGTAKIKGTALAFNNGVRDWFTISNNGVSAGQILLETKFVPAGGGHHQPSIG
jgi:hypothetical protein